MWNEGYFRGDKRLFFRQNTNNISIDSLKYLLHLHQNNLFVQRNIFRQLYNICSYHGMINVSNFCKLLPLAEFFIRNMKTRKFELMLMRAGDCSLSSVKKKFQKSKKKYHFYTHFTFKIIFISKVDTKIYIYVYSWDLKN